MRGDRPAGHGMMTRHGRATPHARGSTFAGMSDEDLESGYPACAGIDLAHGNSSRPASGLPRMRGDRPHRGAAR